MRLTKLVLMIALAVPCVAFADWNEGESTETVERWQVDMRGKPPYKRELVRVPVVEAARLEVETVETETRMNTEFGGKPPFRRRVEEVPITGDDNSSDSSGQFRGRPPFYRH